MGDERISKAVEGELAGEPEGRTEADSPVKTGRPSITPFAAKRIDSWGELRDAYEEYGWVGAGWIFRGQKCSHWDLRSTLERTLDRYSGKGLSEGPIWEYRLQREFTRHAYQHDRVSPREGQTDEWWALMRHHGAPTRLLDWTYSFWVAVFFAVERASPGESSSVWIIDRDWLRERTRKRVTNELVRTLLRPDRSGFRSPEVLEDLVKCNAPFVWTLNPLRFNRRHALQQSVYLLPGCISVPFMDNIRVAVGREEAPDHCIKLDLCFGRDELGVVLREILRMNISRATLFPGLDGFSASLCHRVLWPEFFKGIGDKAGA